MKYFTQHIKSSFAKKILQIYIQCIWDNFFLVHAPEGVIENYGHMEVSFNETSMNWTSYQASHPTLYYVDM